MAWQPTTLTIEQQEERRLEGGRLLLEGTLSQAEIARHLGVTRTAVCHWKRQLAAHGNQLTALAARRPTGAPAKLTEKHWQQLLTQLSKGAMKAGFATERWTLGRIGTLIHRRWGISLSTVQIRHHLHKHGWSVQKPQPQASQRDDELVRAWLAKDWPRIKKSLAQLRHDHHDR